MADEPHESHIDSIQPSDDSMRLMLVMLAAIIVAVGAVLGLVRTSEALMLAISLPAASIAAFVVITFILRLAGEGEEPDPDA
jgi:uncharacterized membrane protein